jgi:26S proteasome regulatory subunit N7
MAPFYEEVCQALEWEVDGSLLTKMKADNEKKLKQLDDAIEDAEKNLSEMEVREANLKKSEHLSRIGDKVYLPITILCLLDPAIGFYSW